MGYINKWQKIVSGGIIVDGDTISDIICGLMHTADSALDFMYCSEVSVKNMFVLEHPRATVTLKGLDVTNIMHCG